MLSINLKHSLITVLVVLLFCPILVNGQNVGINSSGILPDSSAILDISDTAKGVLIPRVSTTQRMAIAKPATSLLVFDSTTTSFWFYNGTAWQELIGNGANDTLPLIIDADRDTWVHTEQNPDEDIIRFVTDTTERWTMQGDVLYSTSNNVLIGTVARDITFETTSSKAILIGNRNGVYGTENRVMNHTIGIGDAVFNARTDGQTFRRCIAIGKEAGSILGPPGGGESNTDNIAIGEQSLYHQAPSTGNSVGNVGVGTLTLGNLLAGEYNVALGHGAGNVRFGTGNVFLGRNSGMGISFDYDSLLFIDNKVGARPLIWGDMAHDSVTIYGTLSVGSEAAGRIYTLPNTDGIPNQVLQTNGAGDINWVTVAGLDTLPIIADDDRDTWIQTEQNPDEDIIRFVLDTNERWRMVQRRLEPAGTNYIFIGTETAPNQIETTGHAASTYVGHRAAYNTTQGSSNSAFGSFALGSNQVGHYNVAMGVSAVAGPTHGHYNIGIGFESLADPKVGASQNIAIGAQALKSTLGSRNIALGYQAGDNAAFVNTSDQLIIENSNSATPLIWGDFANDSLTVHGTLSVADPTTGNNYYSFPTSTGTVGDVLALDGSNQLVWATGGAGSDNQQTDVFQLNGNNLELSLQNDGIATQIVDLSGYLDNTDNQDLTLTTNTLSLTNDATTVDLSGYLDNTDSQATDVFQLNGNNLELSLQNDGVATQTVDLSAFVNDTLPLIADADRNTTVHVEKTPNEDQIVFEMAGTEYLRLINGRFQTSNDLQSVRIGNRSGENLTGVQNVLIGETAGTDMTTGAGNLGIGGRALDSATAVFNNVALGINTMRSMKTGGRNVAVGAFALQNIDNSSNYNTAIGAEAGGEATGWRNVFIGYAAGYNATGGDKLFIANSITDNPLIWGDFANDSLTVHGTFSVANPVTGVNYFHMNNGRMHVVNTGLSVFIGDQAGANDDLSTNQNVFIGDNAGVMNTTGDRSVYIGSQAGATSTTANRNVAIGRASMSQATGSGNIMLGDLAGQRTQGNFNIGIGVNSAWNRLAGSGNISMGVNSARDATSGDNNVAIGSSAMLANQDGSNNVAVGNGALSAGTNGIGNVAIGNQAGANETGDSTLYIANSNTVNPLIYGEFNNNILRANGTFQISNPATTGYAFPAATGTTGQVLEVDASGDLVWANQSIGTDNQQADVFQLNGNNLELSLQNDGVATQNVDLSGYLDADNLGDHTATQNIQTNGNWVSNDGGNEGVLVHTDGSVSMSTVPSFSTAIVDVLNPIQSTINSFVEVGGASGTTLLSGGWTTARDTYNHNDGGHFNTTTGRFTAPYDGLYFFSAHIRVDGINAPVAPATLSFSRLVLAVNGDFMNQIDGAMHSIVDHNAGTGDWSMHSISGVMKLTAGQYVSLGVVSHSDDSWRIIGESGFSGYMITRQ